LPPPPFVQTIFTLLLIIHPKSEKDLGTEWEADASNFVDQPLGKNTAFYFTSKQGRRLHKMMQWSGCGLNLRLFAGNDLGGFLFSFVK